jgi:glucose/arabinose dehydrogenase
VVLAVVLGLILPVAVLGARSQQTKRTFFPVAIGRPAFSMTPVGSGFTSVTEVTHAGDNRLFVAEQAGVVKILHPDGHITIFLDIRDKVISHRGEYGFFDIAFHPEYANPSAPGYGLFYVTYTSGFDDGVTLEVDFLISRFRVSADPNIADRATEAILLKEEQSFDVHKGGGMEFDPRDHMLYVGMGDDRLLLIAQSNKSPKGKIIRLAVDKVPPDFVGDGRVFLSDEIWAFGLRNPWRIDVDPLSNQIFVGEVGDALWEEVNVVPLGLKGLNYGWPCMEGPHIIPEANDIPECESPWLFKRAIHEYPHQDGSGRCAIIGGKVNRPYYAPTDNRFIFADMCTKEVFALAGNAGVWERTLLGVLDDYLISTIGEDVQGVQYIGTLNPAGPIYRLYIP